MDINTFIEIYRPLIVVAFIIAFTNWAGYTILAPWNKSVLGWIIWTKFLANVLILFTPFMQVMFSQVPFRYESSIFALCFFIVSILSVGIAIYVTQIKGYLKKQKEKRERKKVIS